MKEERHVFMNSPLMNRIHLQEIADSPKLYAALKNNMTADFFTDMDWRMDNGKNANIFIEGQQGTGKSTIARIVKCYIDKYNGRTACNCSYSHLA